MKFPPSQHLGVCYAPNGEQYSLHFYGENEGAAVVTGPSPEAVGRIVEVPEVHREDAANPAEARAKLIAWKNAQGWN